MRHLAIILITAFAPGCATSAFAEVPPNPLPAPQQPAPKRYSLDEQTLAQIQRYLDQSTILYSVKCQENGVLWYCQASALSQALVKGAKEVPNEKPADAGAAE